MKEALKSRLAKIVLLLATVSVCSYAQGTAADYERAGRLKAKYEAAVVDVAGPASWIGNSHRFWYRKLSRGVNLYTIFDADTSQKNSAFDHDKIAASLSKLTGNSYKGQDLPLAQLRFDNGLTAFNANLDGTAVRCTIADSVCSRTEFPTRPQGARSSGHLTRQRLPRIVFVPAINAKCATLNRRLKIKYSRSSRRSFMQNLATCLTLSSRLCLT